MARSRRKSPAGGITAARSDKAFKSLAARKLRAPTSRIAGPLIVPGIGRKTASGGSGATGQTMRPRLFASNSRIIKRLPIV
jgi:hypothetical protein